MPGESPCRSVRRASDLVQTPSSLEAPQYDFGNRIQHTDPASVSPGRLIASFAMSCVCRCANSAPTKLRETLTANAAASTWHFATARENSLDKSVGLGTHLSHGSALSGGFATAG